MNYNIQIETGKEYKKFGMVFVPCTWTVYTDNGVVLGSDTTPFEKNAERDALKVIDNAIRKEQFEIDLLESRKGAAENLERMKADGTYEWYSDPSNFHDLSARKLNHSDIADAPRTRYVEDEFGEIVQETEIIEDVDNGLIPRPDPQDVDNGLIPRVNIKKQIMRVQVGGSQVYQLAEIVDDVCVDTLLWSSYELRGFWLDGDIMGWTVSQLRDYGFVFDNR